MTKIHSDGVNHIDDQQKIAYVIECGNGEENIVESAHCRQAAKIKHGVVEPQLMARVIDSCQTDNQHRPD